MANSVPSRPSDLVQVEGVTFAYDKSRIILRDINMTIPRGKVVAIMGLSGCGKTTLLRLIGGWLRPGIGEVRVDGEVVNQLEHDALFALRRFET